MCTYVLYLCVRTYCIYVYVRTVSMCTYALYLCVRTYCIYVYVRTVSMINALIVQKYEGSLRVHHADCYVITAFGM